MIRPAILLAALTACAPLAARPIDADWPEVASASDGRCTLSITGNGQVYRIAIEGLEPGEAGRYLLTNGDMTPIDWSIRANGEGLFARYYMPFRWSHEGGTVTVALRSEGCAVTASFPWRRATTRVS